MTNADAQARTLVFKDQAGEYYLLPEETLGQGRVPEEHAAEVERLVAGADDVAGYSIWGFVLIGVVIRDATETGTLRGLDPKYGG